MSISQSHFRYPHMRAQNDAQECRKLIKLLFECPKRVANPDAFHLRVHHNGTGSISGVLVLDGRRAETQPLVQPELTLPGKAVVFKRPPSVDILDGSLA